MAIFYDFEEALLYFTATSGVSDGLGRGSEIGQQKINSIQDVERGRNGTFELT